MSNWDKAREYFEPNSKLGENEKDLIKASLKDDFIKKWYLDRDEKVKEKTKLEQWRDKFRTKDSEYECDNIQTREVLFEKHNSTIDKIIKQKIALNQQIIKSRNLLKGFLDYMPAEKPYLSFDKDLKPILPKNDDIKKSENQNPMVEFIDLCDFFS